MDSIEYTHLSNFLHVSFEKVLLSVSKIWGFTWKAPPHDIAIQLMNHTKQFIPDNEGGE